MASAWTIPDAAAVRYPSTARGAVSSTSGDNLVQRPNKARLHGIFVADADAASETTLTIYEADGTTEVVTLAVQSKTARPTPYYEPFGPGGMLLLGGFSLELSSTALVVMVLWSLED